MRLPILLGVCLALLAGCARARNRSEAMPECSLAADRPDAAAALEPADPAATDRAPRAPGASNPVSTAPSQADELCDGSDEVRLIVAEQEFGLRSEFAAFEYPYGEFLAIDGHCHFYAQSNYMQGIRHGELSTQDAGQIARELAVRDLDRFTSTQRSATSCIEGWVTLVAVPNAQLSCSCDECSEPDATHAVRSAEAWLKKLASAGSPVVGSVDALATIDAPMRREPPLRTERIQPWPLSRPMRDIASLIVKGGGAIGGARFEGSEASALRKLRSAAVAMPLIEDLLPSKVFVQENCETTYGLHVRDRLPEAIVDRFERMLNDAWSNETLP